MAKILAGLPVRESIKRQLIGRIKNLSFKPKLVIIQVGDRADSNIYIKNKIKFGEDIGVSVILKKFKSNIEEFLLIEEIKKISNDIQVNGIIVQLPLTEGIDSIRVINSIPRNKDADGLTISPLFTGQSKEEKNVMLITPATAKAVLYMLNYYDIEIKNKKIAVIGKSRLAGGPISELLKSLGAFVENCDRSTKNTKDICKNSDIIISAAGQVGLVNKNFVKEGQVIIDVGINKVERREEERDINSKSKLVGDVSFEEVAPIVEAITPVPGGVGLVTVACLFENLIDLCYHE